MGVPSEGQSLGAAKGSITIDTSDVAAAGQRVRAASAEINRAFVGVKAQAIDLNGVFGQLGSAIGISLGIAGAVQLVRATNALIEQAAQVERVRISYDRLAKGVGQDADAMLDSMRKASHGMVSDANLVLNANRAMITGVADTAEEMGQLLEIARVRGQALGITTSEAFTRLTQGIGKREIEILDELGIIIKLNDVYDKYAKRLGTTADALTEAQKTQAFFNAVLEDSRDLINENADASENAADKFQKQKIAAENLAIAQGNLLLESSGNTADFWTRMINGLTAYLNALKQAGGQLFPSPPEVGKFGTSPWGTRGAPPRISTPGPQFNPEQIEIIRNRFDAENEIQRKAAADRLDATRQYEEQRTSLIRDFEKTIARDAEDFALGRKRQEEDTNRSLERLHRDAARREECAAEDLQRNLTQIRDDSGERIADAREDANERLVKLEKDYQKQRERSLEDHQDKLLDAAGHLDAVAVREEQRRFARQSKDAKEAHEEQRDDLNKQLQKRIDDEKENLEERTRQAQEAFDRQIEDAREADQQRIDDEKADQDLRKIREDEDRATRLTRMGEDHQDQLDELARQHALNLEQIATQKAEERAKLQEEFGKALHEAGIINSAWIKENNRVINAAIEDYTRLTNAIALAAAGLVGTGALGYSHPSLADPYVDRPMPAGSSIYTGAGILKMLNINTGAIVINGDGLNEQQVADKVIEGIADFFEEHAR
jgi:hypothetical protein